MEKIFAIALILMIASSVLYLLIGFVIIPVIKTYKEIFRLKRNARLKE